VPPSSSLSSSSGVGEHLAADVDADDLARRRQIAEFPPGSAGDVEDATVRLLELHTMVPTGDQPVELPSPGEFVRHVRVRVGNLFG